MINYDEGIRVICRCRGSVIPKSVLHALPAAIVAIYLQLQEDWTPGFRKESGLDDILEGLLWNSMSVAVAILLGFRTAQAFGRFWEGTSLLHKMQGEWFDVATLLTTFSRDSKINKKMPDELVDEFRWTLVRLMSLMHGSALDELSTDDSVHYEVLDIHGIDVQTLAFLRDCKEQFSFNRVEALQHMMQVLITHNHHNGVLSIPPPILGRTFQSLSRGLVNLLNAKKIKDTMFPFPYAQSILVLLLVHSLFVPILITQVVSNKVFAALLTLIPVFGIFSINFVAGELEMPFGQDDNDLPLQKFQKEFNNSLLMLVHDLADHLCFTSAMAVLSFDKLTNFARASLVQKKTAFAKKQHAQSDSKSPMAEGFLEDHARLEEQLRDDERRLKESATFATFIEKEEGGRAPPPNPPNPPVNPPPPAEPPPVIQPQSNPMPSVQQSFSSLFEPPPIPDEGDAGAEGETLDRSASELTAADCFKQWTEVSEDHIDEMRCRTDTVDHLFRTFPDALIESNAALQEATASLTKYLDRLGADDRSHDCILVTTTS